MYEPPEEIPAYLILDLDRLQTQLSVFPTVEVPFAQLRRHVQAMDTSSCNVQEAVLASPDLRHLYSGHGLVAQQAALGLAGDLCVRLVSEEQLRGALLSEELFTASECAAAIALKLPWAKSVQAFSFEDIVLAATRGGFEDKSVFDKGMQRDLVRSMVNIGLAFAKYSLKIRFRETRTLDAFTQTTLRASIKDQFTQLLIALVGDAKLGRDAAQAVAHVFWTRLWDAFAEMKRSDYHYQEVVRLLQLGDAGTVVKEFATNVIEWDEYTTGTDWLSKERDMQRPAADDQLYVNFTRSMQEVADIENLKIALHPLLSRVRARLAVRWRVVLLAIHCLLTIAYSKTRDPVHGTMIVKKCGPWVARAFFEFGSAFYA